MRVGYLCMQSEFSVRPLEALLAAGHDVRFVMRPLSREHRRDPVLRRIEGGDDAREARDAARWEPFAVAAREGVPRFWVGDASSEAARALYRKERVDVIVVAFFNQLLRPAVFQALPCGAVNAHPSLLPAYRGPAPLFWTFHDARAATGVTVHEVTPGEDDGRVFSQTGVDIPFGTRGELLVPRLAAAAAAGVVDALARLERGERADAEQDHAVATRARRPVDEDLTLNASWPARRLFSFVRGVGRWHRLVFQAGEQTVRCIDAVSLEEGATLPADWALYDDTLTLQCPEGRVTLRVRDLPS